jgi:uncharacterized integral membrane protein
MKIKIVLFMIIIVLFTVFVTQNTQPVTIKFFSWGYDVPSILLIVISLFIGLLLGLLLFSFFRPRKNDKTEAPLPPTNVKV